MSSLIDHGPHTVEVFLEETVTDSYGNPVRRPSATAVTVTGCLVTPVSSSRGAFPAADVSEGQRVAATFRLLARDAPIGWWSRVIWQGRSLSVLSGPLEHVSSDGTRHVSVTLHEER